MLFFEPASHLWSPRSVVIFIIVHTNHQELSETFTHVYRGLSNSCISPFLLLLIPFLTKLLSYSSMSKRCSQCLTVLVTRKFTRGQWKKSVPVCRKCSEKISMSHPVCVKRKLRTSSKSSTRTDIPLTQRMRLTSKYLCGWSVKKTFKRKLWSVANGVGKSKMRRLTLGHDC